MAHPDTIRRKRLEQEQREADTERWEREEAESFSEDNKRVIESGEVLKKSLNHLLNRHHERGTMALEDKLDRVLEELRDFINEQIDYRQKHDY